MCFHVLAGLKVRDAHEGASERAGVGKTSLCADVIKCPGRCLHQLNGMADPYMIDGIQQTFTRLLTKYL